MRQIHRLPLQRFRCASRLFHQRGILLRHLIPLHNRLVDLFDAFGLL
jgi:hypothetical protein